MITDTFTIGYDKVPEEMPQLQTKRTFDGVEYILVEAETGGASYEYPYREIYTHAELWRQRHLAAVAREEIEKMLDTVYDGMHHFHAEVCGVDKERGKPCEHDAAYANLREFVLSDPRLT